MTEDDVFLARSVQLPGRSGRLLDLLTGVRRPLELRIDAGGIEVFGDGGESATWVEIEDVYVLNDVRQRYLVYRLTPAAARARGHSTGTWRVPSRLFTPQPAVLLSILDADEIDVLTAVRRFSNGRFPSPERVTGGAERRSTPWP